MIEMGKEWPEIQRKSREILLKIQIFTKYMIPQNTVNVNIIL